MDITRTSNRRAFRQSLLLKAILIISTVQNGIMVTRASRYPILVDPQGQGRLWIMNKEEENQLKVTQINDKNFRQAFFLFKSLMCSLGIIWKIV